MIFINVGQKCDPLRPLLEAQLIAHQLNHLHGYPCDRQHPCVIMMEKIPVANTVTVAKTLLNSCKVSEQALN